MFILATGCGSDDIAEKLMTGSLEVTVLNKISEPVSGAIVTTSPETSAQTTMASGVVSFNNIMPGNYIINVEVPSDIIPYSATTTVTVNQTTSLSIEVGPEPLVSNPVNTLDKLQSIDIVMTSDKTKWTKCVVFETSEDDLYNIDNFENLLNDGGFSREEISKLSKNLIEFLKQNEIKVVRFAESQYEK